jgi:hypothetical protein
VQKIQRTELCVFSLYLNNKPNTLPSLINMSDKKEYDVSELAAYDSDEDVAVAEAGNKDGDVKKYAYQCDYVPL